MNNDDIIKITTLQVQMTDVKEQIEKVERKMDRGFDDVKTVIKELQVASPTKDEVSRMDARLTVAEATLDSLAGDRKWVMGAASLIVLLWGAMALFAGLYVDSRVRTVLAEYEVTLK